MDLGLSGKRALLVGAGRGLGGAAAVCLARERASVALVARTRSAVEERARLCREAGAPQTLAIAADATDPAQLERAVREATSGLGGLDILVTLVGGSQPGGVEMSDAEWSTALDRNLWPAIRSTRLALPFLEASARERGALPPTSVDAPGSRQQSVILHVASIWGREGGGAMSYNVAKAALISLAHEQARELAPRGVRVLSLACRSRRAAFSTRGAPGNVGYEAIQTASRNSCGARYPSDASGPPRRSATRSPCSAARGRAGWRAPAWSSMGASRAPSDAPRHLVCW